MEPFDEDLHRKRIDTITDELQRLAKQLIEIGWSQEQVLAYVKEFLEKED